MKSPVLFIIFVREDTTRKVFEQIKKAQPPRLYIAADGPRPGRPDDVEKCQAVRSIVNEIDWDCEVKTLFREKNLGCGRGVSSAISWFFENEQEGIILEDDILPNIEFFRFCDEMLEKYRDEEKIQMISGYNVFFDGYNAPYSYYMSKFSVIWGWATWRRVWKTYELDAEKLPQNDYLSKLKARYSDSVFRHYRNIFYRMRRHENDTWDFQLFFNLVLNERYSIIPFKNLTENIGFGTGDAAHITDSSNAYIIKLANHHSKLIYPLAIPEGIYTNDDADELYATTARWKKDIFIKRVFKRLFIKLKR